MAAALLPSATRPSCQRSSHRGLGPLEFKPSEASYHKSSGSQAIERLAIMGQAIASQLSSVEQRRQREERLLLETRKTTVRLVNNLLT